MPGSTRIRLIAPSDATAIAGHRARDAEALQAVGAGPAGRLLHPEGQAERIDRLLAGYRAGTAWPGVVLAEDQVIGQVTVGGILPSRTCAAAPSDTGSPAPPRTKGTPGTPSGLCSRS